MCVDGRCGHFTPPRNEQERMTQEKAKASGVKAAMLPADAPSQVILGLMMLFGAMDEIEREERLQKRRGVLI